MKNLPMKLTTLAAEVAALGLLALCFLAALVEVIFRGGKAVIDTEDER